MLSIVNGRQQLKKLNGKHNQNH